MASEFVGQESELNMLEDPHVVVDEEDVVQGQINAIIVDGLVTLRENVEVQDRIIIVVDTVEVEVPGTWK